MPGRTALACSSTWIGAAFPVRTRPDAGETCISGGVFTMGHDWIPDSREPLSQVPQRQVPAHRVRLKPFFIDVLPVTNGEYKACFEAGACPDECQVAGHHELRRACRASCTQVPFFQTYSFHDDALARHPVASVYDLGANALLRLGRQAPADRGGMGARRAWPRTTTITRGGTRHPTARATSATAGRPTRTGRSEPRPWICTTGDVSPEGVRLMVTGVQEFLDDWYYVYPFEMREPVPDPAGLWDGERRPSMCEAIRRASSPHYKGDVSHAPDPTLEPFPLPAWTRDTLRSRSSAVFAARMTMSFEMQGRNEGERRVEAIFAEAVTPRARRRSCAGG